MQKQKLMGRLYIPTSHKLKNNYMKFYYFSIIFLSIQLLNLNNILGQSDVRNDVATPKNSSVEAWITSEDNSTTRGVYDATYTTSSRILIKYFNDAYSSSRRFNCHGYAWHMVEGGDPRWIGYSVPTSEDIYMTDGSYIQVCNETYPGKVSWADGDHSAITTSAPGVWTSKWNRYPLMTHDKNDNPFGFVFKYYVSTKISGNTSNFCSGTRTFSVQNISGATYSWIYSSTLSVIGSTNTSQIVIQRNGSLSGPSWVEVQISTPCSPTSSTRRINFSVGTPPSSSVYADWDNPFKIIAGADPVTGATSYKWYVNNVFIKSTSTPNTSLSYNGNCTTSVTVGVEVVTSCGTSGKTNTNIGTAPCDNYYIIAPNPAQDVITISAGEQSGMAAKTGLLSSSVNNITHVKIFNSRGIVLKSLQYTEPGKQVQVNLAGLTPGIYFVEVSNGNNKQTKMLVITR